MFSLFAAPLWAEQITVFAAASLRNALEEVGEQLGQKTPAIACVIPLQVPLP